MESTGNSSRLRWVGALIDLAWAIHRSRVYREVGAPATTTAAVPIGAQQ